MSLKTSFASSLLKINSLVTAFFANQFIWVYPKIAVSLKLLLFYPNPKGDKRNFKMDSLQKWDTPIYFEYKSVTIHIKHTNPPSWFPC
jgi:hypothetical protein